MKQDWKPTGIRNKDYEIMVNSGGITCLYFKGESLPKQTDLTFKQTMGDSTVVTITFLLI